MQNKNYDQPFRLDMGKDEDGYHRIRLGRTIYGAKDDHIYYLIQGEMTLVPFDVLKEKSWIQRNINEVLGVRAFDARVVSVLDDDYHLVVNGTHYIANVTTAPTRNLDKWLSTMPDSHTQYPEFLYTDLLIVENGVRRKVTAAEVSDRGFQAAVKGALNYRRKLIKNAEINGFRYSRNEARAHKQRRFNSTSV